MKKIVLALAFVLLGNFMLSGCSKDEILDHYNNIVQSAGAIELTGKSSLEGTKEKGIDDYTGTYTADYEDFSDTFVSIHLDEGEHEIELYYETPGLKAGAAISAGCVCIFLLLLLFRQIVKRRSRLKFKANSDR